MFDGFRYAGDADNGKRGGMKVRIFKPSRSVMQSARGRSREWLLEPELETPRRPEPLMGWLGSRDTLNQIRLAFPSAEIAVEFARGRGWDYTVSDPGPRRIPPKNYSDNFRSDKQ